MQISEEFKKLLIDELKTVAKKVSEEKDFKKKNYFFSGAFGTVSRIFNFDFDHELILIHSVLNLAYGVIDTLQKRIERGEEEVIEIPDKFFDKLADLTKELALAIDNDENVYEVLQKIAVHSYILSGNGYYLYQKGIIKI
uniref:Uncharacterized protein n=2 Tax=Methanomicrobia TaxID=224756 RepID=A0A7H1KP97_9EURY|nr:hypothetical protein KICHMFME_00007 [Methanosarcinales archaeon ANME-1 ERB7]QNT35761.1 hypothetical protein MCFLDGBP_00009 [uncultured Methanosarcinales archaeon]